VNEKLVRIASPIALVLLWELVVRLRLFDPLFFPAPSSIVETFLQYARSGELASNTAITFQRILVGLVLGAVPGIAVGLAMGMNRWAAAVLDPIVALLYPIPKIAILPLVLLIFGLGEESKYALVAIGVFFIMAINTQSGVRQIEPIYLDVTRAFRIRPLSVYLRVVLPGAMPNIFTGLKLSIGVAVVLAVAAEFSAARNGLGYTIWNGWQTGQVEKMYVALVVVSVVGFLMTAALDACERYAIPWRNQSR
jgi:ABC-type nitrate/sulfonate/bicarbonate transport system permease component